jgi:hypothetical protein
MKNLAKMAESWIWIWKKDPPAHVGGNGLRYFVTWGLVSENK